MVATPSPSRAQQPPGRLPHLCDRSGRRAELRRVERLDRVDHTHIGTAFRKRRANGLELGLGKDLDFVGAAEPRGAELHLRNGLLPGDEQRPAATSCHRRKRGKQERRLANTRFASDEDERCGDEPPSEHAVELGDARRDSSRVIGLDVGEPHRCR